MALSIPTIHMNGTSKESLLDALVTAMNAIRVAMDAMGNVSPNGRDYYPQGPDATQEALRQHANRMHSLNAVCLELSEIAEMTAGATP